MDFRSVALVSALVYFACCIGLGAYYARRQRTVSDYILAGRTLPVFAIAASLIATNNSSGNVIGIPGLTYGSGFGFLFWLILFTALAYIPMIFYSGKVNATGASTMPDYVYQRYGNNKFLRYKMVGWTVFWTVMRMGIEIYAMALIVQTVLGIPWHVSVVVVGLVTVTYTALGGLAAVATTDVFQWAVVVAGTALIVPFLYANVGPYVGEILSRTPTPTFGTLHLEVPVWTLIGIGIAATFWPLGDPTLFQRFLSGRSPGSVTRATALYVAMIYPWWLLVGIIGIYAAATLPGLENPDSALLQVGMAHLPVLLGGVVFAAIIAGAMSTADSALNTLAAVFMHDVFRQLRPDWDDRRLLALGRAVVVVVGLVGILAAPLFSGGVIMMAFFLQMFFIAAVVPVVFGGVMWPQVTPRAAVASTVVGTLVVVIWALLGGQQGVWGIPPSVPSLLSGTLVLVGVTLWDARRRGATAQPAVAGDD